MSTPQLLDDLDDYNSVVDQFISTALTLGVTPSNDRVITIGVNSGRFNHTISGRLIQSPTLTAYSRGDIFLDNVPGSPTYRNFVIARGTALGRLYLPRTRSRLQQQLVPQLSLLGARWFYFQLLLVTSPSLTPRP